MVGSVIKIARQKKKISREKLAEYLGVSASWVAMIERGERGLKGKYIPKICTMLDLKQEDFLYTFNDNIIYGAVSNNIDYSNMQQNWKELSFINREKENNITELEKIKNKYLKAIKKIDNIIKILEEE